MEGSAEEKKGPVQRYPQVGLPVVYMAKDEKDEWRSEHAAVITSLVGDGLNVNLTVFEDGIPTPKIVRNVPPSGTKGSRDAWRWPRSSTI